MDNTSLHEVIERIPELNFRYIGCLPADFVPIFPKLSFSLFNTSSSSGVGEHWIMIGCLNRNYYCEVSLARSVTHYKLLKKNYEKMILIQLQKMQKWCVFSTTYAAFHPFQFLQTNLYNVHDVACTKLY